MNQANQENNLDASANIPVKRKRGRPRKYPSPNFGENARPTKDQKLIRGENARVAKDQNLNRGENAHVPPGFGGANGNQPRQAEPIDNANDVMVGQVVSGVIEASFDAGYLLSVRVGNSETNLRGVVFKPGRYIPVSAENDVAPGVQMIRRNEIPLPTENYSRMHGYNPRSRQRNEQLSPHRNGTAHPYNESPAANQVSKVARVKHVPPASTQTASSVISRGNLVPVMLQPVNISNGSPLPNLPSPVLAQAAHLVASKGKQVSTVADQAVHFSNGSIPTDQMPTVGNQGLPSQPQSSHQVLPKGIHSETGPFNQPSAEAKSMRLPNMPFEKLLTEVIKRIQAPSQPGETQVENSKSAGTLPMKNSGHTLDDEVDDMNQPLEVEPLQAVQPDLNHSASVPNTSANNRTGKMTELLQVLQERTDNQAPRSEELARGSGLKLDESRSPDTWLGDEESVHSKKHAQALSI